MTTVEPPAGLDLNPIRKRSEASCPPAGPKALWAVAASAADVPDLIAEVEALRLQVAGKVGICGNNMPGTFIEGAPTMVCDLPAGHEGWHGADNLMTDLYPPSRCSWSFDESGYIASVNPNPPVADEVRGLRQELDEARAERDRMLNVYRAAERYSQVWGGLERFAARDALLAAVDAYRSSTPDAEPAPGKTECAESQGHGWRSGTCLQGLGEECQDRACFCMCHVRRRPLLREASLPAPGVPVDTEGKSRDA